MIRVYSNRLFRPQDHLIVLKDSLCFTEIKGVDVELTRQRIEETLSESKLASAPGVPVRQEARPRTHAYPDKSVPNILIYITPFDDPLTPNTAPKARLRLPTPIFVGEGTI